jgi:hypothetical protein
MELLASKVLGTVFFTLVVYVVGAFTGPAIYKWVSTKLPWNK